MHPIFDRKLFGAFAVVALTAVSLGALDGCAQDVPPGSCFRERDNGCTEYGAKEAAAAKRMCQGFRWTDGAGTCPKDGRVGACVREGGRITETMYEGPPNNFTVDVARSVCERSGGAFHR